MNKSNELGDALVVEGGAMIRRWCRQSSPSLVSSGFLKAGTYPCAMVPPRNAALAEAQHDIRNVELFFF
jgi:hypothetical protein